MQYFCIHAIIAGEYKTCTNIFLHINKDEYIQCIIASISESDQTHDRSPCSSICWSWCQLVDRQWHNSGCDDTGRACPLRLWTSPCKRNVIQLQETPYMVVTQNILFAKELLHFITIYSLQKQTNKQLCLTSPDCTTVYVITAGPNIKQDLKGSGLNNKENTLEMKKYIFYLFYEIFHSCRFMKIFLCWPVGLLTRFCQPFQGPGFSRESITTSVPLLLFLSGLLLHTFVVYITQEKNEIKGRTLEVQVIGSCGL